MNRKTVPQHEYVDRYLVDGPLWLGLSRGIAAFFGVLCLLDVLRAILIAQAGSDYGWIDLSPCPPAAARGLLAFTGVALLLFSCTHRLPRAIRPSVIVGVMALVAAAIGNAVSIHRAVGLGEIEDGIPMPAHVVTLLVPVVFGMVRGSHYGPLRFPVGGCVLCIGFVAAAFAFSVGYVSSVSKFHQPRASEAIVVLHPRADADQTTAEEHARVTRDLVRDGYSSRVILVNRTEPTDPALDVAAIRAQLPPGSNVSIVSAVSDSELIEVLGANRSETLLFVGDRRDSTRIRMLGQQPGGAVSFVAASDGRIDDSILQDVRTLWTTWLTPLRESVIGSVMAEATAGLQPQQSRPVR